MKVVAIQGYAGSFHHKAAESIFGKDLQLKECDTFSELVELTEHESHVDYGLMAIENSIAGTILPNYQLLKESKLLIVAEIYVKIGQHMMALPGQDISEIVEVHSHHMALKQSEHFLKKHPHIKAVEKEDTALSARNIARNKTQKVAAIGSEIAAELYGLEIIAHNIERVSNNFTRFLLLSKTAEELSEPNKASFMLSLKHEVGALENVLRVITSFGYNLSKIQSFPIIEAEWQYYFVLDLEATSFKNYQALIRELHLVTQELRVLGTYKKGETI